MAANGQSESERNAANDGGAFLISGRIDRLPLTRVQWELAILVEITWGFIIVDTDGIGARLYPVVWRPLGVITTNQYAVIQALQVGLGVLLGTYLMSFVAEKYGRRPALLASTALAGLCLWPFAFVTSFWPLVLFSIFSTLGVGGIVATHAVYLSEMTSHSVRNKTMLTSQASTALVGVAIATSMKTHPVGLARRDWNWRDATESSEGSIVLESSDVLTRSDEQLRCVLGPDAATREQGRSTLGHQLRQVHVDLLDLLVESLDPSTELTQGELGGLVRIVEMFEVRS